MKPLEGLTVVFTGRMSRSRADMEADAHRQGAYTEKRVTARTNWLVTGDRVGKTKMNAAHRVGCKVLTENEYWDEIRNRSQSAKPTGEPDRSPAPVRTKRATNVPDWARSLKSEKSIGF
jgi:BRCT domain type II-containing protein